MRGYVRLCVGILFARIDRIMHACKNKRKEYCKVLCIDHNNTREKFAMAPVHIIIGAYA